MLSKSVIESYRLLIADVYDLAGVSRRTSDRLAKTVGQTAARWHVLSVISDGPRTVASAARRLGLSRQAVQRVAGALSAEGLVALRPNPDHASAPLVDITAEGMRTMRALFALSEASRAEALERAGVSRAELDAARSVLRRLVHAIEEVER